MRFVIVGTLRSLAGREGRLLTRTEFHSLVDAADTQFFVLEYRTERAKMQLEWIRDKPGLTFTQAAYRRPDCINPQDEGATLVFDDVRGVLKILYYDPIPAATATANAAGSASENSPELQSTHESVPS